MCRVDQSKLVLADRAIQPIDRKFAGGKGICASRDQTEKLFSYRSGALQAHAIMLDKLGLVTLG